MELSTFEILMSYSHHHYTNPRLLQTEWLSVFSRKMAMADGRDPEKPVWRRRMRSVPRSKSNPIQNELPSR